MDKTSPTSTGLYPTIAIERIQDPKRFYAIPIFGGLVKIIMLIPVAIWFLLVGFVSTILTFINSFVVLFTGTYWKPCYEINILVLSLLAKLYFFLSGLSNNYPGFGKETKDFTLTIPYPQNPNFLFAFPILGGLIRFILLFPYIIYNSVLQYAAGTACFAASFSVLFTGTYPESLYELNRDSVRVNMATLMYFVGFSDKYPSWWISMNHKNVKILLLILGALLYLWNQFSPLFHHPSYSTQNYQYPTTKSTY